MQDIQTTGRDSRVIEPEPGATVTTFDDRRLGTVKACTAGYFQVGVRWGRDYWLSCDLIRKHEPGRTVLNISRSVLGGYKQRRPGQVSEILSDAASRPVHNSAATGLGTTAFERRTAAAPWIQADHLSEAGRAIALARTAPQIPKKE